MLSWILKKFVMYHSVLSEAQMVATVLIALASQEKLTEMKFYTNSEIEVSFS